MVQTMGTRALELDAREKCQRRFVASLHLPHFQTGSGAKTAYAFFPDLPAQVLSQSLAAVIMALETLRYGAFKAQWVGSDPKALPGCGGDVASWPDYKFAVQALERKEATLSDMEKKKLGPLGLRLVDRLAGPALQVAKRLGIDKLAESDGAKEASSGVGKAATSTSSASSQELYQAGTKDGAGVLSRQYGEPMSSYCLRREAWWTQLREMDTGIDSLREIVFDTLQVPCHVVMRPPRELPGFCSRPA